MAKQSNQAAQVFLKPDNLHRWLVGIVFALVVLSALAYAVLYPLGQQTGSGGLVELGKRFDMDHEINLPTWFSSSLLLLCAFVLGVIALAKRAQGNRFRWHWAVLALAFVYLSLDETANLHELLIVPIRRRLGLGGFLYFAWVIPGVIAVGCFGLAFVRFLWNLEARSRWRFIYGGSVYVGGALGMELIGGAMADWYGFESARYIAVMMAEETLEMLGLIIFLLALIDYVKSHLSNICWLFDDGPAFATGGQFAQFSAHGSQLQDGRN